MKKRIFKTKNGYTLFEACVAMIIICILVTIGTPIYTKAIEQARLDSAVGNLKTIWAAQRAYWLKYRTFTNSLDALKSENLISSKLTDQNSTYTYNIEYADNGSFTASATRNASGTWSGQIVINENGQFSGGISKAGTTVTLLPMTLE